MGRDRAFYREVALLHSRNMEQGFLSSLGVGVLTELYRAINDSPQSVLFVEEIDGRIVGFVAGGRGIGPIMRQMLRRPVSLVTALAPLVLQPRKVIGIAEILRRGGKRSAEGVGELPAFELLAIAVAPQARRGGVAKHLYERLCAHFRQEEGADAFRIVVGDGLEAAQAFYRRMGAVPQGRVEVHSGRGSTIYVQRLGNGGPAGPA